MTHRTYYEPQESTQIFWHTRHSTAHTIGIGTHSRPQDAKQSFTKPRRFWGSWASRGTDVWYLGPLADHYRCNIYYVPETRVYRISGSAELFPQHCQVPNLSNNAHLKALTDELETSTGIVAKTDKRRTPIKVLAKTINNILTPPAVCEQRVDNNIREVEPQRKKEDSAPITRISDAPAIMKVRDPTAKRNLIKDARTHRQITQNNTSGAVPAIQRVAPALILPDTSPAPATRRSNRVKTTTTPVIIIPPYRLLGGGTRASAQ